MSSAAGHDVRPHRKLRGPPGRVFTSFIAAIIGISVPGSSLEDSPLAAGPLLFVASVPADRVATFSIVGFDPDTGDLGVAVQSKFFAVGAVVPWARAGVGAVATQSLANTTYGPRGLDLLAAGSSPDEVVATLTGDDTERADRQVGIVDAAGRAASFTGDACLAWAGGRTGEHYAAQGNILAGPEVVDAMSTEFEASAGDLATRLVAALAAGQAAGGDARGRQSAAVLVVREAEGYGGYNDRYVDLRVDDHPTPIRELQRLLALRQARIERGHAARLLREADRARGALSSPERNAPSEPNPAGGHIADAASADEHLKEALSAAERAVALDPGGESGWFLLARVRLELGDHDGAAAAGRVALVANPWIKTALLDGLYGQTEFLERLLEIDEFRRFWETLPSQR